MDNKLIKGLQAQKETFDLMNKELGLLTIDELLDPYGVIEDEKNKEYARDTSF